MADMIRLTRRQMLKYLCIVAVLGRQKLVFAHTRSNVSAADQPYRERLTDDRLTCLICLCKLLAPSILANAHYERAVRAFDRKISHDPQAWSAIDRLMNSFPGEMREDYIRQNAAVLREELMTSAFGVLRTTVLDEIYGAPLA